MQRLYYSEVGQVRRADLVCSKLQSVSAIVVLRLHPACLQKSKKAE